MNYEKDCQEDMDCFNKAMELCIPANVISEEEGSIFEYKIKGKEESSCLTTITINQVNSASGQEVIDLFEGKSMSCLIPRETTIGETNDVLDYCSGPLKESMYELIIQKMYTIVIQNLGETISELSKE